MSNINHKAVFLLVAGTYLSIGWTWLVYWAASSVFSAASLETASFPGFLTVLTFLIIWMTMLLIGWAYLSDSMEQTKCRGIGNE